MNRSFVILALGSLATACTATVNTGNAPSGATESSLMQADRDFSVATHARGIDGWMSFYAPDAIRIRYRGNMVRGFEELRKFDLPTSPTRRAFSIGSRPMPMSSMAGRSARPPAHTRS
jgi:hypothetical protein